MKMNLLFLSFAFSTIISCGGKNYSTCTDLYALNFNPEAKSTDNSTCNYPSYTLGPTLITSLSHVVKETSGLAFFNNRLITHNDKGSTNTLYVINPQNGEVNTRISIEGASNIDWEDLAESSDYLFVGDMGNNNGDRKDLKIYKIKKSKFTFDQDASVTIDEIIHFSYPDQVDFDPNKDHNFDCEAIIYYNNFIYLFSKNRLDKKCNVYKIPAQGGHHQAVLIDTFFAEGRITAAAIHPNNNEIVLLGYNKKAGCFIWHLSNFQGEKFFSGKKKYISLGSYEAIGQTEGVVFKSEKEIYISSEKTETLAPRLYQLSLQSIY
jgi:hypothetical protein